ncbi:hypothetical protein KR100_01990 [Synechococcus sp. KORDI-100]|nr:hypothetical protein KR100_01990 [Synechococcus sp. KORDI-100]
MQSNGAERPGEDFLLLFLMGEQVAALRANDTDLFKRIALLIPPE